jgi:23S rRNA (adenine2503-C2)-methyltransferase
MPLTLEAMPREMLPTRSRPQVRPAAEGWSQRVVADGRPLLQFAGHSWRAEVLTEKLNARRRGWVHVNRIPLNRTPGSIWTASEPDGQRDFVRRLSDSGIPATLRDTRGREIDGACGKLAAADG